MTASANISAPDQDKNTYNTPKEAHIQVEDRVKIWGRQGQGQGHSGPASNGSCYATPSERILELSLLSCVKIHWQSGPKRAGSCDLRRGHHAPGADPCSRERFS